MLSKTKKIESVRFGGDFVTMEIVEKTCVFDDGVCIAETSSSRQFMHGDDVSGEDAKIQALAAQLVALPE